MASHTVTQYLSPAYWFTLVFDFFYVLVQRVIIWLFKPVSPRVDYMRVHRELTRNSASTARPRVPQEPEGQDRGDRRRAYWSLQCSPCDSPRI